MTRAAERARELLEKQRLSVKHNEKWLTAALTEAVEAEREACAKVAQRELERLEAAKGGSYVLETERSMLAGQAEVIMRKIRERSRGEG